MEVAFEFNESLILHSPFRGLLCGHIFLVKYRFPFTPLGMKYQ